MTTFSFSGSASTTAGSSGRLYGYHSNGVLILNDLAEDAVEMLPQEYQGGSNIRKIKEAVSSELYRARAAYQEAQDQMFLATATWGLRYWEQMLGLPIQEGNLDYDGRRATCSLALSSKGQESETYFKNGMEAVVGGTPASPKIIITQGHPDTAPYSITVEAAINYFEDKPTAPTAFHGPWDSGIWYKAGPVAAVDSTKLIDLVDFDGTPLGLDNGSVITAHAYLNGVLAEPTFAVTAVNTLEDLLAANQTTFNLSLITLAASGIATYLALDSTNLTDITYTAINAATANLPVFNATPGATTAWVGFAGSVPIGLYTYKTSFVFPAGETLPSLASPPVKVSGVNRSVMVRDIPISPDPEVLSRKVYRKETAGATWKLVGTVSNNYEDFFSDEEAATTTDALTTSGAKTLLARRLEDYIIKTKPAHLTVISSSTGFRVGISTIGPGGGEL